MAFSQKSDKIFFDPFCETFLTNRGKNKDEDEKIRKNDFDFRIFHVKIRLCINFPGNLGKSFCPIFKTFLTNLEKKWK